MKKNWSVVRPNLQSIKTFGPFPNLEQSRYSKSGPEVSALFPNKSLSIPTLTGVIVRQKAGLELGLKLKQLNSALWPMSYYCFICSKTPKETVWTLNYFRFMKFENLRQASNYFKAQFPGWLHQVHQQRSIKVTRFSHLSRHWCPACQALPDLCPATRPCTAYACS